MFISTAQREDGDSGYMGSRVQGYKEKWKGNSPSPLILSLGGARKNKEKGYHRLQGEIAARPLGARNDRKAGRLLVYPVGLLRSSDQ